MLNVIKQRFVEATSRIGENYLVLPMDGRDAHPLERVYAYELYHQLRVGTDEIEDYSWGGEVDKISHPHFNGPGLKRRKPDLLFHRPGDHEGNLVVAEIKTNHGINRRDDVKKDLITLSAFRHDFEEFRAYQWAVYLVVGGQDIDRVVAWANEANGQDGVDLRLVDLFWHESADEPAQYIEW